MLHDAIIFTMTYPHDQITFPALIHVTLLKHDDLNCNVQIKILFLLIRTYLNKLFHMCEPKLLLLNFLEK